MKESISKGYAQAKEKFAEIKAELEDKQEKPSDLQYGQVKSNEQTVNVNHPIFLKKECPFCSAPLPPELLAYLKDHSQVICEHCGSTITL